MYLVETPEDHEGREDCANVDGDPAREVGERQEGVRELAVDLGAVFYPSGIGRAGCYGEDGGADGRGGFGVLALEEHEVCG